MGWRAFLTTMRDGPPHPSGPGGPGGNPTPAPAPSCCRCLPAAMGPGQESGVKEEDTTPTTVDSLKQGRGDNVLVIHMRASGCGPHPVSKHNKEDVPVAFTNSHSAGPLVSGVAQCSTRAWAWGRLTVAVALPNGDSVGGDGASSAIKSTCHTIAPERLPVSIDCAWSCRGRSSFLHLRENTCVTVDHVASGE